MRTIVILLLLTSVVVAEPPQAPPLREPPQAPPLRQIVEEVKHQYRWVQGAVANQLALQDGSTYVGVYRLADRQYLSYVQGQWFPTTIPDTAPEVPQVPFANTVSSMSPTPVQSAMPSYSTRVVQDPLQVPIGMYAPAATAGFMTTSRICFT